MFEVLGSGDCPFFYCQRLNFFPRFDVRRNRRVRRKAAMTTEPNSLLWKCSIAEQEALNAFRSEFVLLYPAEVDCIETIYQALYESNKVFCHHCSGRNVEHNFGERVVRCSDCKQLSWFTADTFFHHMRVARPLLLAMFLLGKGVYFNSSTLHKLTGIAHSSATYIYKKIMAVVTRSMPDQSMEVPSAMFLSIMTKRSIETPAREHPSSEEEAFARRCPKNVGVDEALDDLTPAEKATRLCLGDGVKTIDELHYATGLGIPEICAALTGLQLMGLILELPGARFKLNEFSTSVSQSLHDLCATVTKHIRHFFQGVSRKYLQYYVSAYWTWIDRTRWSMQSLLSECSHAARVVDQEIDQFVTAAGVRLWITR